MSALVVGACAALCAAAPICVLLFPRHSWWWSAALCLTAAQAAAVGAGAGALAALACSLRLQRRLLEALAASASAPAPAAVVAAAREGPAESAACVFAAAQRILRHAGPLPPEAEGDACPVCLDAMLAADAAVALSVRPHKHEQEQEPVRVRLAARPRQVFQCWRCDGLMHADCACAMVLGSPHGRCLHCLAAV